jgi:hypothetical protein
MTDTGVMGTNKNLLNPGLSREQELMQEFQQAEAAERREELEPVDERVRDERRTWAEMADDAGIPAPEHWAPWAASATRAIHQDEDETEE